MSDYQLGQRVRFSEHIKRTSKQEWEKDKPDRFWTGEDYPGKRLAGGEGIIIGKRTLTEGNVINDSYDDGWGSVYITTYAKTRHFTAWLVVKDLRSKPVHVLPEHLEPA